IFIHSRIPLRTSIHSSGAQPIPPAPFPKTHLSMRSTFPLGLLSIAAAIHATAADQTWLNSSPINTWDTTSLNWDAGVAWTNGNNALFAGSVETVSIGGDPIVAGTVTMQGTGEWVF